MTHLQASFADVRSLAQAGRLEEAFELILKLSEQKDPEALVTLADFYWQGGPVDPDPRRARDLYRRASDAGHPQGRIAYTNLLGSGLFGSRDWKGAVDRLQGETALDPYRARVLAALNAMDLAPDGAPRVAPESQKLSDELEVDFFPGLFSAAECNLVLAAAENRYLRSTINDSQGREVPHPLRSSEGAALHWLIEDPAIQALNRRLAAASQTPYENAEPLLVLRYGRGQEYRRHFDALPGLQNQRAKTALVYLNDEYSGGETEFPKLNIKVKGRRGDVLVFRNAASNGAPDPLSEHAGLPVTSGVKYLGSRWIRADRHLP